MNTQSILSGRFGGRHTAAGAAILMAAFGVVPVSTLADQRAATTSVSSVADVALSDLNLSRPEGMRVARDRLHTMAERVCANRGGSREPSSQPTFGACVDSTVANALRQIEALRQTNTPVRNSVTRSAIVSFADLDLSTLEGSRIARERLEAMAQRLCRELARRQDPSYQPNYTACVQDTLAGALAQANALVRNTRTARRNAP
ncbi:MAG: UrcA family protein [Gammaproteobacteria bacterium]|nr:MAG: UrcA family protein [Gammaproteobacteria bacterium]